MAKHSISILLTAVCGILQVDPYAALARVGWSDKSSTNVDAEEYLRFWNAIIDLAGPNADLFSLGLNMANGPINPIFLAFASAPNLEQGLVRMSRYKTLFGPVFFKLTKTTEALVLEIVCEYDDIQLPASLSLPIGIFALEKSRMHTTKRIIPRSITVPQSVDAEKASAYFGLQVKKGNNFVIEFSKRDAAAPFISENESLWNDIELDLERQLKERDGSLAFRLQVDFAIRKLLIAGPARAEQVCTELNISRSTLQRNLKNERQSFQDILDKIRLGLTQRYLAKTSLKSSEISRLVGFSDPKSFHRAFKKWTTKTPQEYREHIEK